jgi:pimeloyl-ACP methyl ester carboxylesterase
MSDVSTETWAGRYRVVASGAKPPAVLLLHANGFNGGTYLPLLEALLPQGGWAAPDFRGHGGSFIPDAGIPSWRVFVDDVRAWQAEGRFDKPVVIGHSLGGVTALMTEALYPGTFRAIALLDPVIFSPGIVAMMAFMQLPGLKGNHPLAKGARARRMRFASRDEVLASYRKKKAFAQWAPGFLENYVRWGTHEEPGGVRLACPGEIEAQIFSSWPIGFWFWVSRVTCPVLILRGAHSDTFWEKTALRLARALPRAEFHAVPGAGHFLPMEQPGAVIDRYAAWSSALAAAPKSA